MKKSIKLHIKKRAILAGIITLITLAVTFQCWFIFKPMHVALDLEGKSTLNVNVFLNKLDEDGFREAKEDNMDVDLNKTSHVNFHIGRSRFPKRVRIVLSNLKINQKITLSNLKLGKFGIDDLSKFTTADADIKSQDNKLIINPKNTTVTLNYPKLQGIRTSIKFDFNLFVIIAVLTFLLTYKLSDYVADFKTVQGKSRIEIVFLCVFFIFLFIPMSFINQDEISQTENRVLTKWYPLIKENKQINFDFGKNFNAWFNDRFYLRNRFINKYYQILSYFSKDYYEDKRTIYNKGADFAYHKWGNSVNRYLRKDLFSEHELAEIHQKVSKLKEYCQANNVKLYIMLSNDKESIYPEYYPTYYKPNDNISRREQVYNLLLTIPNLDIISPTQRLLQAKQNRLVFLPYDTHLNTYGSYLEYEEIMSNIKNNFPYVKQTAFTQFDVVTLNSRCDTLPPKRYLSKHHEFRDSINMKNPFAKLDEVLSLPAKHYDFRIYNNNYANNRLKLVIIGDSFHQNYIPLLAESFSSVKSLLIGNGEEFILDDQAKDILFKPKPNILIIETTERFLSRLMELDSFFDIFE